MILATYITKVLVIGPSALLMILDVPKLEDARSSEAMLEPSEDGLLSEGKIEIMMVFVGKGSSSMARMPALEEHENMVLSGLSVH